MDYQDPKQIEQLLPEYFRGTLPADQARMVDAWISCSEANRQLASKVGLAVQLENMKYAFGNVDTEAALRRSHGKIRRNTIRRHIQSFQRAAAILIFPVLLTGLFFAVDYFSSRTDSEIVASTVSGMVSQVTLPDGSQVWLNSNTTLRYPASFGNRDRVVSIDGEGFFKVAKNGHRFTVKAGNAEIEVLGTEFNVEAYPDKSPNVKTTLVSGSVKMAFSDKSGRNGSMLLTPGKCCLYDASASKLTESEVNTVVETSWKDGRIVLDNTSLEDALKMVENRFNVRFLVKNGELLKNRYTGTFTNQRMDLILEYFKHTTNIRFEYNLSQVGDDPVAGRQVILVY